MAFLLCFLSSRSDMLVVGGSAELREVFSNPSFASVGFGAGGKGAWGSPTYGLILLGPWVL